MFKSFNLLKKLTPLFFILLVGLFVSSCGEDEIVGCTDPNAENFDAEANVSGNCVFTRDKFIGSFLGSFSCSNPLLAPIVNSDSLVFSITEGVDDEVSNVIFNLQIEGIPVPLRGTVSGNVVNVDDSLEGVTIPGIEVVPGIPLTITANVTGSGNATLSDDNQTLAGNIRIEIEATSPVPLSAADDCAMIGTRQ